MNIEKVLITDAVDVACVELLKKHSISVDCKYKLPKDQLIEIIKVCSLFFYNFFVSCCIVIEKSLHYKKFRNICCLHWLIR